jgi:hypothetical protein
MDQGPWSIRHGQSGRGDSVVVVALQFLARDARIAWDWILFSGELPPRDALLCLSFGSLGQPCRHGLMGDHLGVIGWTWQDMAGAGRAWPGLAGIGWKWAGGSANGCG